MKFAATGLTQRPKDEHEADTRPLSLKLIVRLIGSMKPYALRRNILLVLVIVRSMQLPTLAWLIGAIIGGPISGLDMKGVLLGALAYAVLAFFTQFTLRYRSRLALELGEDVVADLRNAMFNHIQKMPMSFFDNNRLGRIISRFTSDSEAVRQGVQNVLFVSMVSLGQMLGAAAFMIWYDHFLFLIIVGMSPILWALNRFFGRKLSIAYRAVQESFSRITATLAESVGGIRVTQSFVRERTNAGLFHDLVKDHSRYNLDVARAAGVFIPLLEFNTQVFISLVLLFGGYRVLHGVSDIEDLYQFVLMAGVFFGPIQTLASQYNNALAAMAGAERVFAVLDSTPAWTDPPDARPLPPIRGRVEFRNVTFSYSPDRPVLHDVSFVAEPGQTVAIVGHSGSGKSTIANLISKFYLPTQGAVLIDGHDLTTVTTDSLQRQTGVVLQQNFLFTGTVLDNIRIGRPGANRNDVVHAAKILDCLDLIAAMPDGFNTLVGERGSGISLGQRQLICFIRAMLANPHILILDEATSSVDTMTEVRIQQALRKLLVNRTSVVVAHRLSTIRHADQVIVLEHGRIVERGCHEELLIRGQVYAELYREFIRTADTNAPRT